MSLEIAIEKNTQAIQELIAALQSQPLNIPKVETVAAPEVKETKPKAETKKKPEPVKEVAKVEEPVAEEPEIEDLDLDDDVIEGEVVSEEIPQLPAGERTSAYYVANVQPVLQKLGALDKSKLVDLIRVQFSAEKGNLIPADQWDALVHKANGIINAA